MPLKNYGVMAGRVLDTRAEGGTGAPHFQIRVGAAGADFRVAVTVLSRESPSEPLYVADEAFDHPVLTGPPRSARRLLRAAGQARHGRAGLHPRIPVEPPVLLGPEGGLLTLLDPAGLKVDGVAYTEHQAPPAGATIVF